MHSTRLAIQEKKQIEDIAKAVAGDDNFVSELEVEALRGQSWPRSPAPAVGVTIGGLTGALIGLGIPEYEAKRYYGKVQAVTL